MLDTGELGRCRALHRKPALIVPEGKESIPSMIALQFNEEATEKKVALFSQDVRLADERVCKPG